jgi:hypothetical protein
MGWDRRGKELDEQSMYEEWNRKSSEAKKTSLT